MYVAFFADISLWRSFLPRTMYVYMYTLYQQEHYLMVPGTRARAATPILGTSITGNKQRTIRYHT